MAYNNSRPFFEDEDLKTPEHDEMLLWCLKDENILKFLEELKILPNFKFIIHKRDNFPKYTKIEEKKIILNEEKIKEKEKNYDKNITESKEKLKKAPKEKKEYYNKEYYKKEIEVYIKDKEEFSEKIKELTKLKEKIELDFLNFNNLIENKNIYKIKKIIEYPIVNRDFTIGFLDIKIIIEPNLIETEFFTEHYSSSIDNSEFNIEIKPKIKSIGETIRQINNYKTYINIDRYHIHPFILITKTKGLKDIFSSQNIYVYELE